MRYCIHFSINNKYKGPIYADSMQHIIEREWCTFQIDERGPLEEFWRISATQVAVGRSLQRETFWKSYADAPNTLWARIPSRNTLMHPFSGFVADEYYAWGARESVSPRGNIALCGLKRPFSLPVMGMPYTCTMVKRSWLHWCETDDRVWGNDPFGLFALLASTGGPPQLSASKDG